MSLLDFAHAELGLKAEDGKVHIGAFASIWSPSISFSIFNLTIGIGFEAGSIGAGFEKDINSINVRGALLFGGNLQIEWD